MTSARIHLTAVSIGVSWHFPRGDHKDRASMQVALQFISQGRW